MTFLGADYKCAYLLTYNIFGTDPTDTGIRINPKNPHSNPVSLSVEMLALAEVCVL